MNRDDDYDEPDKGGGRNGRPTRDAKGRWLKGYCPNPKDRPSKAPARHASANGGNRPISVVRWNPWQWPLTDGKAVVRKTLLNLPVLTRFGERQDKSATPCTWVRSRTGP